MRQKTDSITHLVKIVAEEVFDEKMKQHQNKLRDTLEESFALARAGESWSQVEDDLLIQEIEHTLHQIATKHGRTAGAIRARISQRGIIR